MASGDQQPSEHGAVAGTRAGQPSGADRRTSLADGCRALAIAIALFGLAGPAIIVIGDRAPDFAGLALEEGTVECVRRRDPVKGRPSYLLRLEPSGERHDWIVYAGCLMPSGMSDIHPGDRLRARVARTWGVRHAWQIERDGSVLVSYADLVGVNRCFITRALLVGVVCQGLALGLLVAGVILRRIAARFPPG